MAVFLFAGEGAHSANTDLTLLRQVRSGGSVTDSILITMATPPASLRRLRLRLRLRFRLRPRGRACSPVLARARAHSFRPKLTTPTHPGPPTQCRQVVGTPSRQPLRYTIIVRCGVRTWGVCYVYV